MKILTNQNIILSCIVSTILFSCDTTVKKELPESNSQPSQITLNSVEMNLESQSGVLINESAFYTCKSGVNMISIYSKSSKSDRPHMAYKRSSSDNGKTWSHPEEVWTEREVESKWLRRFSMPGFVDPVRDVMLTMQLQCLAPTPDPYESAKYWKIYYVLSKDCGKTNYHEGQVITQGEGINSNHPMPGVWESKNSAYLGDKGCIPIRISTGEILVPIQINLVGAQKRGFFESAVLIGTWNEDEILDWQLSETVSATSSQSPRGFFEPTLAEMPDGRILMIVRAEGGHKWYCVSGDHGRTWSKPQVWTYSDGSTLFSPSSMSQLIKHSNGRFYWIGNLLPGSPEGGGNTPRYPLVIGEVDQETLLLIKETLCNIDKRNPHDPERMQLSNFYAHQDRETGEIVLHLSPWGRDPNLPPYTGSAYLYRLKVTDK